MNACFYVLKMSDILGSVKFPTSSSLGSYYDNLNGCRTQIYPRVRYHNIILEEDGKRSDCVNKSSVQTNYSSDSQNPTTSTSPKSSNNAQVPLQQTYFGNFRSSPINRTTYFGNFQPSESNSSSAEHSTANESKHSSRRRRNGTHSPIADSSSLLSPSHHSAQFSTAPSNHTRASKTPSSALADTNFGSSSSVSSNRDAKSPRELNNKTKDSSAKVRQRLLTSSEYNPFGEDCSEFEYKKYMKLLRSNSFGSIGDIYGHSLSPKPPPSNDDMHGNLKTTPSNILATHLQSSFNSIAPSLLLRLAQHNTDNDSVLNRSLTSLKWNTPPPNGIATPFERKRAVRNKNNRNGIHNRNNSVFRTITDIDIGDGDRNVTQNGVNSSADSKNISADVETSFCPGEKLSKDKSKLRRNSIAFGSNWSGLDSSKGNDWLYRRNGFSPAAFNALNPDTQTSLPKSPKNSTFQYFSCVSKPGTTIPNGVLGDIQKSQLLTDSSSVPHENWRIICDDKGILLENNIPNESLGRTKRESSTQSEFDEVAKNIHKLVGENAYSTAADNHCSFKISDDAMVGSAVMMNSLKGRRRNSISGSLSGRDPSNLAPHLSDAEGKKSSTAREKFMFGSRRGKSPNIESKNQGCCNNSSRKNLKHSCYEGRPAMHDQLSSAVESIIKNCNKNGFLLPSNESANNGGDSMSIENPRTKKTNNFSVNGIDYNKDKYERLQKIINSREVLSPLSTVPPIKEEPFIVSDHGVSGSNSSAPSIDETTDSINTSEHNSSFELYDNIHGTNSSENSLNNIDKEDRTIMVAPRSDDISVASDASQNLKKNSKARVNHCFGLKNYQNLKCLDGIKNNHEFEDGVTKAFPTRKVARRMTTTGLVRPALQKFVSLGAQRLLRKQDIIEHLYPETDKLIQVKKDSCDQKKTTDAGTEKSIHSTPSYICLEENGLLSVCSTEEDKSSSSECSLVPVAQEDAYEHHNVDQILESVPPPIMKPPRRQKTRKHKLTAEAREGAVKAQGGSSASSNQNSLNIPKSLENFGSAELDELNSCIGVKEYAPRHSIKKNAFDKSTNLVKKKINKVKDKIKGVAPTHIFNDTASTPKSGAEVRVPFIILLVNFFWRHVMRAILFFI